MLRKAYKITIGQLLSAQKRKRATTFDPKRFKDTNPDIPAEYTVYSYTPEQIAFNNTNVIENCHALVSPNSVNWINVDGLHKTEVEALCKKFEVHPLLTEDILSTGQRAKADDMETHLFALLPMLTYNADTGIVQQEQLSIVLEKNWVLSFQPDPKQDPFYPLREKLKNTAAIVRKKPADYLAYCLIDAVVDDYYSVLEHLSARLEKLEDEVVIRPSQSTLLKITLLRHEIMVVKRAITPVRELVASLWQSENDLIDKSNKKYFKDVYDHIVLAIEYTDNYREMAVNVQDLYMNQVNTKMNEVMKILTVVTTLLAPATVIGGIFGMNFDKIPYSHHPQGFAIAVGIMLSVSAIMLIFFRKKGWF